MFLAGIAPGPNTSAAHPQHKVYPYLLRGVPVARANQVWSTDITYVRLERGFACLVAELLIGLTKYFAFYNAERPHQSLGNQTPQHVHETSSGGGAMIVDKYRTKEKLPVALRSSGTALEEVRVDIWPAIPNAKTGAAPSSGEKSSAT
jgi:hypothetical protein